ncbi:MAG TPA: adenylate/guanylate cyclase domain-containing protein, partial [Candidatus Binataceae bacterium]
RARSQLAYDEAARLYRMALQALSTAPTPNHQFSCELMIELGEALMRAGSGDRGRETLLAAADLARTTAQPEALCRAALGIGIQSSSAGSVDQTLIRLLEEALTAVGDQHSALRAMLLARLAAALYWSDQHERTVLLSQSAVQIARELGDNSVLIYSLCMWHYALWGPDNLENRLKAADEMVLLARNSGDREWELRAREMYLADTLEQGDVPGAAIALQEFRHLATNMRTASIAVELTDTMRALLRGEFEDGERLVEQTLAVGQRLQEPRAALSYTAQITFIRFEQGRLGELEPILRAYVQQFPVLDVARCGLALACVQLGLAAEARVEFEYLARDDFSALRRDWNWLATMALVAELCVFVGDVERAGRVYELLLPYAERPIMLGWNEVCYGSVARYLGMLATLRGRFDDAERHFETAISTNTKIGARSWLAHAQHDYAAMLLKRREKQDRARAAVLIDSALTTSNLLGMKNVGESARSLLRSLAQDNDLATSAETQSSIVHAPRDGTRTMVTVMFVDVVGSTELAAALGDSKWRERLGLFYRVVRQRLAELHGREISNPGDGFLAVFDSPYRAIESACAIRDSVLKHDLRIRAGLHAGECEWIGEQAVGIAIHIGARVASAASPDEVLVSSTVRDLVAGGRFKFADAGLHRMKGLPEEWRLFRVES